MIDKCYERHVAIIMKDFSIPLLNLEISLAFMTSDHEIDSNEHRFSSYLFSSRYLWDCSHVYDSVTSCQHPAAAGTGGDLPDNTDNVLPDLNTDIDIFALDLVSAYCPWSASTLLYCWFTTKWLDKVDVKETLDRPFGNISVTFHSWKHPFDANVCSYNKMMW